MMHELNVRDEPSNTVERAAAAGLEAVAGELERQGAELVKCYVVLYASGVPAGEPDCTEAGRGYDSGADLFTELSAGLVGMARELGLELTVIPAVPQQGQG